MLQVAIAAVLCVELVEMGPDRGTPILERGGHLGHEQRGNRGVFVADEVAREIANAFFGGEEEASPTFVFALLHDLRHPLEADIQV